jgi:hypothetical protein
MAEPKPKGWTAFDSLARTLTAVPKDAVDKHIADAKSARKKARKKK